MILSTLAELEVAQEADKELEKKEEVKPEVKPVAQTSSYKKPSIRREEEPKKEIVKVEPEELTTEESTCSVSDDERHFCESMRERILVLFEGFQSPNNKSIEAKVDLTLNFLEYLLAVIDERLETLDNK